MGYRVMVVNHGTDNRGVILRKIYENDLIPYDDAVHTWATACKIREKAMELFPAVIIEHTLGMTHQGCIAYQEV